MKTGKHKPLRYILVIMAAICLTLQGQSGNTIQLNTLVSGVLVTQFGELIPEDVVVTIYRDWAVVARVRSYKGLFSVDLVGKASPNDTLTLHVAPGPQDSSLVNLVEVAEPCADSATTANSLIVNPNLATATFPLTTTLGFFGYQNSHRGTVQKVVLANAQNLNIKLDWDGSPYAWVVPNFGAYWGGGESSIVAWDYSQLAVYTVAYFVTITIRATLDLIPQDYSCTDHS